MKSWKLRKIWKFSAGLTRRPPAKGAKKIETVPENANRENAFACVLGVEISDIIVRIDLW